MHLAHCPNTYNSGGRGLRPDPSAPAPGAGAQLGEKQRPGWSRPSQAVGVHTAAQAAASQLTPLCMGKACVLVDPLSVAAALKLAGENAIHWAG